MVKEERRAVIYRRYGDPRQVLELVREPFETALNPLQVLVEWFVAPINPLDVNKIQGAYVIKLPTPAVGGTEAAGRVLKIGRGVKKVHPGDRVVATGINTPCWCDFSVVGEDDLRKVDSRLTPEQAATMMVNPPTAWMMLKAYVQLKEGDWVIQNSANSGVGRAVIQIANAWNIKTINIVRDRPDIDDLKNELRAMGGDVVWTEEEAQKELKNIKNKPRLALNGVGGRSSLQIASCLQYGATCITYGGMSRRPHEFSTSALVFNDIRVIGVAIGFWMNDPKNSEAVEIMMKEIQELLVAGKLTPPPMDVFPLQEYRTAIERSMDGKHRKQMLFIQNDQKARL